MAFIRRVARVAASGWSYGNRRKGEKVAELLGAAKRLWQTEGIKKLEVRTSDGFHA